MTRPDLSKLPAAPALPAVPSWVPLSSTQAKATLMAVRVAIGALGWLFPGIGARLFGIELEENPASPYLGRLFAVREFALVAPLLTEDAEVQRRYLHVGMAVDSADAAASVIAGLKGTLPRRAAATTFLSAVGGVLLGWIASQPD